ncbi:MAG TPA: carbon monoxide dehydrogenase [Rhodospirillales bacterium]|jgi:carbon monoxide dehydrogenase subunit G|nr:carbon monoxide dehydrogenase [Rhodospirillales bacterium]|tara:strand:- start:763 stop:1353 length:591 start_codon:yes stop_codon:yes gene_type:complete
MDLTGEYRIPAARQDVWEALNDPEVLKQCIDGCQELSKDSDTQFSAKVTAKVGPVKAKFSGKVTLSDLDPPNGYKISGEGQGGVAGFAKGGATVKLTEDGADTVLSYSANAEVGGKLASVGSRLVEGVAKKQADDFFGKFSEIVGGDQGEDSDLTLTNETKSVEVNAESEKRGLSPAVWGGGLIVVVAILLYIFAG